MTETEERKQDEAPEFWVAASLAVQAHADAILEASDNRPDDVNELISYINRWAKTFVAAGHTDAAVFLSSMLPAVFLTASCAGLASHELLCVETAPSADDDAAVSTALDKQQVAHEFVDAIALLAKVHLDDNPIPPHRPAGESVQ